MEPVVKQGSLDLTGIDDDDFFHEAEARIVEALRAFSETATGSASVRRRLFAGDAAQGIALIDLVRTRFDVVLMNPPFGAGSLAAKKDFEKSYPRTKNDVYAAFVERGIELLHPHGLLGAITSRTGFFLATFQKWREEILLKEAPPVVFADLGFGVLDSAMVEVAAYCLEKDRKVTA
jgi:Eco57I restriction-modification methylase